ncbi:hypothetical protein FHW88_002791 [Mucilaginibacter sp. SG538B]|uniref:hypothetical protein n=1 Tax=Mucilaginibacter sp. SG538B TaxID=2587021 RepID=UPI00159E101A|nr:hypothetical protein [Mucilaginibacter sp. SG538B]NVM64502.1 hypothetical protein [Mucilaginibacter sp. SG538B]
MQKNFILALLGASILFSCSKKNDSTPVIQSPLSQAIDSKYIHQGSDVNSLDVNYSDYNSTGDCNKALFQAAIETVTGSGNINTVTVKGATLTMEFKRNALAQPAKTSLTYGTELYKSVNQPWPWTGFLIITKQNTFLTTDQFNKAINIKLTAINTGDIAKVLSKTIADNTMAIEYNLTANISNGSKSVSYELQTNTPITLRSQLRVNCIIPGFFPTQSYVTLDYASTLAKPKQSSLDGNVTSYSQEANPLFVSESLSEYIAGRYFAEKLYPTIK